MAVIDTASATSMIFLFRSTGFVSGTAITAAIVQSSFKSFLTKNITGPEAEKVRNKIERGRANLLLIPAPHLVHLDY